jgi:hypothetical protein
MPVATAVNRRFIEASTATSPFFGRKDADAHARA